MYKHFFKRLIDLAMSLIGIVVLAIPMAVIAVIIKIDSPGPVFFKQKRIGLHKQEFNIIKFRSMPVSAPPDVPKHKLQYEKYRLSKWQKIMRRASLDELPQLYNIFFSQMSIIGPRPALWNMDDLIAERDKYGANDVKPGLTGWAQINGRDELDIAAKARFDGDYVKKMSFQFDCKCFFGTIKAVIKCDGVVEGGTSELHKASDVIVENDRDIQQ